MRKQASPIIGGDNGGRPRADPEGRYSVYFSITADEWPAVKRRLEEMLPRGRP